MNTVSPTYRHIHFIGIGGIHVSAVAKLLMARGVSVSGSDAYENDETKDLRARGARVAIGHNVANLPSNADAVVFSHAVREDNPEMAEAKRRGLPCIDTHAFLASLFEGAKQVVIAGSHGKSTTTTMTGIVLSACGADPTVVVGTKVSEFSDGNLRIGRNDLLVVEGDEYQRHLLSYRPSVLVINNVDLDHVDVYPTIEVYEEVFAEAIKNIQPGGTLVVNADDPRCERLAEGFAGSVLRVGKDTGESSTFSMSFREAESLSDSAIASELRLESDSAARNDIREAQRGSISELITPDGSRHVLHLMIPGEMNVRNAAMALTASRAAVAGELDVDRACGALAKFGGCWRRFEHIGTYHDAIAISDYGHHPTEVAATLAAAHGAYPDKRVILVFQPHHRNRTRNLFDEFVSSFDGADALILPEIYDVPGRESPEDAGVSSAGLADAVRSRDAAVGKQRSVTFIASNADIDGALAMLSPGAGDIIIFMGAGAIDGVARGIVEREKVGVVE